MRSGIRSGAVACVALLAVAGCGNDDDNSGNGNGGEEASDQTIRVGHVSTEVGAIDPPLVEMGETLAELSDGSLDIQTYPNGQLGGDLELLEQVQSGNIEAAVINIAVVAAAVPEAGALELPFLFESYEHAHSSLDGEVGEYLDGKFTDAGIYLVGFWEAGFKTVQQNDRSIASAEDAAGVSIAVLETPTAVTTYSALNMNTTPLPYPEVYTAIQQGVVSGFEGTHNMYVSGGLQELTDYSSELDMVYSSMVFIMNPDTYDSLSPEQQEAWDEAAATHTAEQREHAHGIIERDRQVLLDEGIEILEHDDIDIDSFREATAGVADQFLEYQELVDIVESTR